MMLSDSIGSLNLAFGMSVSQDATARYWQFTFTAFVFECYATKCLGFRKSLGKRYTLLRPPLHCERTCELVHDSFFPCKHTSRVHKSSKINVRWLQSTLFHFLNCFVIGMVCTSGSTENLLQLAKNTHHMTEDSTQSVMHEYLGRHDQVCRLSHLYKHKPAIHSYKQSFISGVILKSLKKATSKAKQSLLLMSLISSFANNRWLQVSE